MNKKNPTSIILELAVEDYSGLWEIIEALQEILPEKSGNELKSIAENNVRELLSKKWISLYQGGKFSGEERTLSQNEIETALSNPENWNSNKPTQEIEIRFAATKVGELAYYKI